MKLTDFGETIPQAIENIKCCICDSYCKYQEIELSEHKDPDEAMEYLFLEFCNSCPLNFL